MLSQDELTLIISDIESDRVERTESTSNTDKFAQAVCAFANDLPGSGKPGHLLVGVKKDGALAGLKLTEQNLEVLGQLRAGGNIQPLPTLTVAKFSLPGGDIAVVEVHPSLLPPVRYKGQVWIRLGPTKAVATEQDERILMERRIATARSFDVSPCPEATIKDLSLRLFEEYRIQTVADEIIQANHRGIQEQLGSLRCFDINSGFPTHAGLLLFGINARYFLPGAYIQFAHFQGSTTSDRPFDQEEVSGDLRTVLDRLRDLFRKVNENAVLPSVGFREKEISAYPEWAIRELLHNAVLHRDYQSNTPIRFYAFSDRIEIHSPGGLYGEVTPETLMTRSSYRNPVLAEAFKALGYVNRFGYGIQRVQTLLKENGSPPAEFIADQRAFAVIIHRRQA